MQQNNGEASADQSVAGHEYVMKLHVRNLLSTCLQVDCAAERLIILIVINLQHYFFQILSCQCFLRHRLITPLMSLLMNLSPKWPNFVEWSVKYSLTQTLLQ